MKNLILGVALLGANTSFAQEQLSTGRKIGMILQGLKYLAAPAFRGEEGMQRLTDKPKFDRWLDDLKQLTDEATDTNYEQETQFQHAIFLIEERLQNDQFALSGYHHSKRTNRKQAKREEKTFNDVKANESFKHVYDNFVADEKSPQKRTRGPIFANKAHFKDSTTKQIDGVYSLESLLKMRTNSTKCESVCPNDHRILRVNRDGNKINIQDQETHLAFTSFRNINEDFDQFIKKQFGFCWGHTSTLYKFKQYARFNQQAPLDSIEVLKEKLQKLIREEEIVTFNGIASIRELSDESSPDVRLHLMREIAREWARNAMTIKNILALGGATKELKYKDYIEVYNDIVARILSNQIVQIKFNAHDINGWSHIVNAYGFQETEDEYRIFVQDPNIFPEDLIVNEEFPFGDSYLAIKKKKVNKKYGFAYNPSLARVAKLQGSQRLGLIEVTTEGRLQIMQTIDKYAALCREKTQCEQ